MKIAICNELFQGWPIQKVFDYAAGLGYDGVEIAPFTLADSVVGISQKKRTEIRRAAEKSGIEIVGLHLLLAKPEGLHISHPDEIIRVRTQEYIEALIHLCADIGGDLLLHGSSHQRKIEDKWGLTESRERARETFEICLKTARRRKVTYCIEPLLKANTNFINTVEEALRLIEEINQPSFRLVFDCRSASVQERSVTDALVKAIKSGHLRHIHINDVSGKGPGFGDTRFTPILKTLIKYGYRGYISVEVFDYGPDPQTIASRSIGYLKGILETLE